MRYHPISHRIGHTIRWWAEPWSQGRIRTYNEQPSLTDGLGTVPHYTPDLPVLPWQGCTLYGNRTRDFAVKGRRLNRLSNRANCGPDENRTHHRNIASVSRRSLGTCQPIWAGEGIRTLNSQLGRLELYQLSYSRNCDYSFGKFRHYFKWMGWSNPLTSPV